jgi:hypothetical protein
LVFFEDNTVGIVAEVQSATIYVISGDVDNAVSGRLLPLNDDSIDGWGMIAIPLPEDEHAENELVDEEFADDDFSDDELADDDFELDLFAYLIYYPYICVQINTIKLHNYDKTTTKQLGG